MKSSLFHLPAAGAIALLLAACGGSQSPFRAPSETRFSWMSPAANSGDLLYVSTGDDDGAIYVYTFPKGRLVGGISATGYSHGLCSNSAGDVFITNDYAIYEYPHGSASPSAVLTNPYGASYSCSVDPTTGDLAAVVPAGNVAIFRPWPNHGWHLAKLFAVFSSRGISCAYDASGNLFADGANASDVVVELPAGKSKFERVTLGTKKNLYLANVEWDGKYVAIGEPGNNRAIHRFKFTGTKGTQVSVTRLKGAYTIYQFWIQGDTLIGPATDNGHFFAGFWQYPHGGALGNDIPLDHATGATVSVAP